MKFLLVIVFCLTIFLLPWKKEGKWQNIQTGQAAGGTLKAELDRKYFGIVPSYHSASKSIVGTYDVQGI